MWDRSHRLVYERAFRAAQRVPGFELGRAPTTAEIAAQLSPCEREALGIEVAVDDLEGLEAILVPCGC